MMHSTQQETTMKTLLIILLAVLFPLAITAQPLDTLWTRYYPDLNAAQPTTLLPSFNGGLIWSGSWLYRADSVDGHSDLLTVETDGLGNPLWTFRVQGVTDDTIWSVQSLCRTADSCYLVMGRRHYQGTPDAVIFKLDRSGTELWRHSYHFSNFDLGYSLATQEDNTALLCMTAVLHNDTFNVDATTTLLVKLNSVGDTVWTYQTYYGPGRVVPISDGWMVISNATYQTLIKMDRDGHVVWLREYYDIAIDDFVDLVETPQGYFVAGIGWAYGSDNFALLHVGFDGEPITVRQFIPDNGNDERVVRIVRTDDDGLLMGGYAMSSADLTVPMVLLKTDAQGARQWHAYFDTGMQTYISAFCGLPDGDYAAGGLTKDLSGGGFGYAFLARFGPSQPNHAAPVPFSPRTISLGQNFPNPFNPNTAIEFDLPKTVMARLMIYDVLGREVARPVDGVLSAGHHVVAFEAATLSSGTYYYTLETAEKTETRRMMLVK
jgi:hypothetical protein